MPTEDPSSWRFLTGQTSNGWEVTDPVSKGKLLSTIAAYSLAYNEVQIHNFKMGYKI
jgi:hypothetical protein